MFSGKPMFGAKPMFGGKSATAISPAKSLSPIVSGGKPLARANAVRGATSLGLPTSMSPQLPQSSVGLKPIIKQPNFGSIQAAGPARSVRFQF